MHVWRRVVKTSRFQSNKTGGYVTDADEFTLVSSRTSNVPSSSADVGGSQYKENHAGYSNPLEALEAVDTRWYR